MPTAYIKKLSDEGKGSIQSLEKKWDHAKSIAKEAGHDEEFDYITGIFNKMIKESLNETKKKIGEYTHGSNVTKVYKLSGEHDEGDPYIVQLHKDGKHYEPADYFTNDEEDAHGTAKHMVKESEDLEFASAQGWHDGYNGHPYNHANVKLVYRNKEHQDAYTKSHKEGVKDRASEIKESNIHHYLVGTSGQTLTSHTTRPHFNDEQDAKEYQKKYKHSPAIKSAKIIRGRADMYGFVTAIKESFEVKESEMMKGVRERNIARAEAEISRLESSLRTMPREGRLGIEQKITELHKKIKSLRIDEAENKENAQPSRRASWRDSMKKHQKLADAHRLGGNKEEEKAELANAGFYARKLRESVTVKELLSELHSTTLKSYVKKAYDQSSDKSVAGLMKDVADSDKPLATSKKFKKSVMRNAGVHLASYKLSKKNEDVAPHLVTQLNEPLKKTPRIVDHDAIKSSKEALRLTDTAKTKDDHYEAAKAHEVAEKTHQKAGNYSRAYSHEQLKNDHFDKALSMRS